MEEKGASPPLDFHSSLPAEWPPAASTPVTRRRGAPALRPSPHGRILPLFLLRAQLNVIVLVPPPAVPHRHENGKEDQDDAAGATYCCRQDAYLRNGRWIKERKKERKDKICENEIAGDKNGNIV